MNAVRAELYDLLSKSYETQQRLDESVQQVQQLKDQNALLRAQKGEHCLCTMGLLHLYITCVVTVVWHFSPRRTDFARHRLH